MRQITVHEGYLWFDAYAQQRRGGALAPTPQEVFLARPSIVNQPPKAGNGNQLAWPLLPFPSGWFGAS
jgi:hypothetical protein